MMSSVQRHLKKIILSLPESLRIMVLLLLTVTVMGSCREKDNSSPSSLVNTSHLDHLYTEVVASGDTVGAIWIYCEAPDYRHVGDEDEGFTCVDDVARALIFYCEYARQHPSPAIHHKIKMLTRFLLHMYAGNGLFYNFMFPDGRINKTHINSEAKPAWWTWRAFLGLVSFYSLPQETFTSMRPEVKTIMDSVVLQMGHFCDTPTDTVIEGLTIPSCLAGSMGADQAADILLGLVGYQHLFPETDLTETIEALATLIQQMQYGSSGQVPYGAFLSWQNIWHAWGNRQAYALLEAGRIMDRKDWVEAGLAEVQNFYPHLMTTGFLHEFKLSKSDSVMTVFDTKIFPQIAYGMEPMILASAKAFEVTGDTDMAHIAVQLTSWFFGNNPARESMYDPATGRGFDGIVSENQINRNAGAESTIEALLAVQAMEKIPGTRSTLTHYLSKPPKQN